MNDYESYKRQVIEELEKLNVKEIMVMRIVDIYYDDAICFALDDGKSAEAMAKEIYDNPSNADWFNK